MVSSVFFASASRPWRRETSDIASRTWTDSSRKDRISAGKEFDPVLVKEVCSDLPVVEPVHPELEDFFCKLFLRAAAERGVPAVAPQEFVEKSKDLFPDTIVQGIVIDP